MLQWQNLIVVSKAMYGPQTSKVYYLDPFRKCLPIPDLEGLPVTLRYANEGLIFKRDWLTCGNEKIQKDISSVK